MDAKPVRNRANTENALPSLHQRHKSTGNLSSNLQGALGGFRNPAKRAAFGDVTNLARNIGDTRDEVKAVKPRASVAVLQRYTSIGVDKENQLKPQGKDGLSGSVQRPATSASDFKPFAAAKPAKSVVVLQEPPVQSPMSDIQEDERTTSEAGPEDDKFSHELPPARQLQPRHFKSQPYLKKQVKLRRTVSSQWDKARLNDESEDQIELNKGETSLPGLAQLETNEIDRELSFSGETTDEEVLASAESMSSDGLEPLSHVVEEEPNIVYPNTEKEVLYPSLSEPEEYWDDEEYYDIEEHNYTTAHSFPSKDMSIGGGSTAVLAPRVTKAAQRELDDARQEVERTRLDEDNMMDSWDISMVAEYGDEIFEYMQSLEVSMMPNPDYMDNQTEIRWSMRSVLMDWLVQVHARFNLLPETLFLTVNYIDRFLSNKVVSIGRLQLVGATAILVASKYEEIHSPCLSEIIYMVDGGYTMDELLKAERFMLNMLDFELGWPGPMSFLRRVSKGDDYDVETRTLAKYFLELTIMDERFVASRPSFLAAGAHCLSRFILNKGDWTAAHIYYSGYTWSQLKQLVTLMIECCEHPQEHHAAIYEKYSSSRFKYAAISVQDALDRGFTLPHHELPIRQHVGSYIH